MLQPTDTDRMRSWIGKATETLRKLAEVLPATTQFKDGSFAGVAIVDLLELPMSGMHLHEVEALNAEIAVARRVLQRIADRWPHAQAASEMGDMDYYSGHDSAQEAHEFIQSSNGGQSILMELCEARVLLSAKIVDLESAGLLWIQSKDPYNIRQALRQMHTRIKAQVIITPPDVDLSVLTADQLKRMGLCRAPAEQP